MLTMDDSGSMMFQHMPEETIYAGSFSVASPVGTKSVSMDPGDNATLAGFFIGTIAAQRGNSNWRQKIMRSADTNTVYYNPQVRYQPWALATYPLPAATASSPAGRMANAPVAAAYRDPMNPASGGTVNLTNFRNLSATWCYRDSRSDCTSATESYDPGLYYRLNKDAAGVYLNPSTAANYTEYSINRELTFAKVAARTDCAGAIGATGCSQAEERQNFANWFSYYRTRNLLARGALVEAFAESTDTFRVGWGRINQSSSASIDGVSTTVIQAGVRDFTAATKTSLFNWLYALPANGGTPLPGAMRAVGQYYSRADTKGPWTDNPGSVNATADKSCRRAYHIMVTDGYWNATTTSVVI
jgi:type IV pilus assembly protein PilY1